MVISHPLSASSIYHDPWHSPCSVYMPDSLFSTISFQVFFGLPLAWHPPLHTPYISSPNQSSFCSTCPYHCNLFCCSAEIMSSNPSLSLNSILGTLSCSLMPHIHLTIPISDSFSFLTARSHFHAAYYFAHNCCTISLSLPMIYPYW